MLLFFHQKPSLSNLIKSARPPPDALYTTASQPSLDQINGLPVTPEALLRNQSPKRTAQTNEEELFCQILHPTLSVLCHCVA